MRALVSAMRPTQWVKNLIVVVAPAAAGVLSHGTVIGHTAVAFGAFCLLASSLYIVNDLRDREADRAHPTKRRRAIAAGELSTGLAVVAVVVLAAAAFALPVAIAGPGELDRGPSIVYALVTIAYNVALKEVPVIEFAAVASGFFLRALRGSHRLAPRGLGVVPRRHLLRGALPRGGQAGERSSPRPPRARPARCSPSTRPSFLETRADPLGDRRRHRVRPVGL